MKEFNTVVGEISRDRRLSRETARSDDPNAFSRVTTGVNVEEAEADFAELNRIFTEKSVRNQITFKVEKTDDVEGGFKSEADEAHDEPWDLEEVLRGQQQAEIDVGIRPKHIGVLWDNLTVKGLGGTKSIVKTFPDAIIDFCNVPGKLMRWFGLAHKGEEVDILKGFKGLARPGEMVLVLGRPGSGCTTFLKIMANQRIGYTGIEGDVTYGPFDSTTFGKRYRGEAVYNPEDDSHHPTLTVGQTLGFAVDTKTPRKRPGNMSKSEFRSSIIDLLLKMFNIEHTRNTIVGNQFIRGVSGGERKRVSIAEMMVTSATVLSWDNSTRGLDSSTALDFAKSLRIMTNVKKTTTFVSLYQASENIYQQFDKVLVIDEGRQVFFGPIDQARSYFEDLGYKEKPRQTTPDYLTGCTDPYEREFKPGRSANDVPSTPDALAKVFEQSEQYKTMTQEMEEYMVQVKQDEQSYQDFEHATAAVKRKFASKKSVFQVPFHLQIWLLMRRQFLIKLQDKVALLVAWITSVVIAFVFGSVWWKQPETSAGAFTRGGLLFVSLLFNAFQAYSELGAVFDGRDIINRHRGYAFHRPAALYLAQIVVDLAFQAPQILVFSFIVYFMSGLALNAGGFFIFVMELVVAYLAMTLFFRTYACVSPDFDYSMNGVSLMISLFVLTCGYLVQWKDGQVWLRWLYYVNVLGLGFSGMMINEFERIDLTCADKNLIPSGPGYNNLSHQVCTLAGGRPGSEIIRGRDYLGDTFSYYPKDLWRNFGITVALVIFFLALNVYFGEVVSFGAGGKTVTFFSRENKERKSLNQALEVKREKRHAKGADESVDEFNITSKAILTWENLNYDVPVAGGTRRLLNDIFGYVEPGKLTALMGASGAGKTTLLDVLAARKNIGVIHGDIFIDGKPPGQAFQRGTAYAEQLDVHEPTQTPYEIPREEKLAYVEDIISLLELEPLADAIIGDPDTGLSVEERKRVTIGVELASKPQLLLFLDEPTSGLDSQSAFNIVRFLRKLADAGQAILCTIHQPNSALFLSFDRLLLLQRGGETIYFGDIGPDACTLLNYFRQNGAICPPNANPAEWMLDAIGAGRTPRIGPRDWADIWRESPELVQLKEKITQVKAERVHANGLLHEKALELEYATPLWHQVKLVTKRASLMLWRSPNYLFTRFFTHVMLAVITGLSFLNLDDSKASLQYRIFVVSQATIIPAIIVAQIEPKYDDARLVFYRESASKTYRQFAFAAGMVIAEIPHNLLGGLCFFLPLNYAPHFSNAANRAGYQFLMIIACEFFSVTLGQAIAALTPDSDMAARLNPFITIVLSLFCGVNIPKPNIPKFWKWLYEVDPFTRLIGGMIVTELHDKPVHCKPIELNEFIPPANVTCGEYMKPFFDAGAPGYLVDSSAMDYCKYCAYKLGDEFYKPLSMSWSHRWRDMGMLWMFVVTNLIILFIGSRYLTFNKR
ncbi:ABC-2 type transporter [Ascosphaera apis ARSEF 7405]|uniref:ABC-2 type transporter n=1 Tax=Ascosphaera apis ARSEF 7405 TaxID=392613 RepID=A0A167Z7Z1_9EURO|nr:ABC-2 type transporter [Ascosphaera apis ARSEF 7405]